MPTGRDLSSPLVIVNRFTVKGDSSGFADKLREHSEFQAQQEGCTALLTCRSVPQPEVYTHVAHWRSLETFLHVVHDDTFLARVRTFGSLVEAEADQAVSVGRMRLRSAQDGPANIVLHHIRLVGDHRELERLFGALTGECAQRDGFGGSDLLRSTVRPQSYLGLTWWLDAESCSRSVESGYFRAAHDRLSSVAQVRTERNQKVACVLSDEF
jgi:heme-degrading monooxygenase HmoA